MTELTIADNVTLRSVDELIPYSNNPKEHPDEQVKKIASSIKNYGWDQPIVIDSEGEIIKGHGRLQAAELLDLDEVPVIERKNLTDAEVRASRIADNKTAESPYNIDKLGIELEQLYEDDFDIELTGFEEDDLDFLDTARTDVEPDDPREVYDEAGMPEYENEDKTPEFSIKVNFESEKDLEEFSQLVESTVTTDTVSIWYPKVEKRDVSDTFWESNDES